MSKTWITSDLHLGEERMDLMQRPFADGRLHDLALIANYNSVVAPEDTVYINGDVVYQKANPVIFLPLIGQLNGRKILIRGNHDRPFSDEQFASYFDEIIPEGDGIEIDVANGDDTLPCYITHYPTQSREDRFNLVGHIHSAWKFQLNQVNIGIDVHHFFPVELSKMGFYYNAITQFYDLDVWQAYSPVNQQFVGKRGKQTRYFTPAE